MGSILNTMPIASIIFLLPAILATAIGLFFHTQSVWYQQLFGDEVHSLFFMA